MILHSVVAVIYGVILVAWGMHRYDRGVKDTEERWSEAVGRADDARREGRGL